MTETVIVDPAFLALTTTPSMAFSSAELTCPDSAAADCAETADQCAPATISVSVRAAVVASSKRRICMASSRVERCEFVRLQRNFVAGKRRPLQDEVEAGTKPTG